MTNYLAAMCHYLHLAKPTPRMIKAFDGFTTIYREMDSVMTRNQTSLRKIQLWRGPELRARLEAGQILPGMKRSADGKGVDFNLFNATAAESKDFGNWLMPIVITSRDTENRGSLGRTKN